MIRTTLTLAAIMAALASPANATDVLQQENGNAVNTCTPALTPTTQQGERANGK